MAVTLLTELNYLRLSPEARGEVARNCKLWVLPEMMRMERDSGFECPEVLAEIEERMSRSEGGLAEKAPSAMGDNAPHKRTHPNDLVRSHRLKEGGAVWVRARCGVAVEAVLVGEDGWGEDRVAVKFDGEDEAVAVGLDDVTLQDASSYVPKEEIDMKLRNDLDAVFGRGYWEMWTKCSPLPKTFGSIQDQEGISGMVYISLHPFSHFVNANRDGLRGREDFCYMPSGLEVVIGTASA
jgi:hypothetical protein